MRPLAPILLCAVLIATGCASMKGAQKGNEQDTAQSSAIQGPSTAPRSLRANAIVEINRIFSVKGRALIAAESPDRFRIEVLGPLNSTAALFVSDGAVLYIFSDGRSARYGWDDPRVPFPFRPAEVVSALLGAPPPEAMGYGFSLDESGRITQLFKKENGKTAVKADMADYRKVSGAEVPFSITIKDRKKDLGVRYSSVEVNPSFSPGFFDASSLP